ncbi:MAG: CtkA family protein, partial [Oscillospiraceae bacterium]|nr:CtkA family protein [Oscillospiraceae bacterium]
MIDFTPCEVNKFKAYGGANGNKINVLYGGKSYMLKFPPPSRRNKMMSYTNGCVNEYLACHIFAALGFKTQETLLGTYTDGRGKGKTVVA